MACACKHKSGQVTSVKQVVKTNVIKQTAKPVAKKLKKVVRRPI